jgi:hypothetical protein
MEDNRSNTGYMSQFKRQSACFSKDDPNKMYWMGYFNCGLGFDDYGNWNPLSDKNWKANGKYDTSLYEVDITTGEARRLANLQDRYLFSLMWVDGQEEPEVAALRGDANGDGEVGIADASIIIDYLLNGNAAGLNHTGADCDLAAGITIADASAIIDYLLNSQW